MRESQVLDAITWVCILFVLLLVALGVCNGALP